MNSVLRLLHGSRFEFGMHADVMVGEGRVQGLAFERRHVAGDAAVGRVDRADRAMHRASAGGSEIGGAGLCLGSGICRVTRQASGVVTFGRSIGVVVRVVASHAIEGAGISV